MRTLKFGVIGCGLMGREFASALMRWGHLTEPGLHGIRPEIVSVCSRSSASMDWFTRNVPTVRLATPDYRELLAATGENVVDAVYIAVPHHLHAPMYLAALAAGKHLMGEKPFGIDYAANESINAAIAAHPNLLVRCSSEFPYFPAMQKIGALIERQAFGRLLEVEAGFLHSSDLDTNKAINWKRQVPFCGEYGCMGDLGMHVCHIPFRADWRPRNVRAVLSKIVGQRPDGHGGMAACDTWDNATLLCEAQDAATQDRFPMTLKMQRIAPGERNTWYLTIKGTKACARFSTAQPKTLEILNYAGGEQVWGRVQVGYEPAFKTITGGIFEFGFTDAMLQMWAAFIGELAGQTPPARFAGCVTPAEAALSHRLLTAALESQRTSATVALMA